MSNLSDKLLGFLKEDDDNQVTSLHSDNKQLMAQSIRKIESELARLKSLIGTSDFEIKDEQEVAKGLQDQVIEGVFAGEHMVSADGKVYSVPANYASKSKLVEGDILKLTINPMGGFIFKQIRPIERKKVRGVLHMDERKMQYFFVVEGQDHQWKLLTASVTYFKGEPGDEVIAVVPKESLSQWAAVEQIVKGDTIIEDDEEDM